MYEQFRAELLAKMTDFDAETIKRFMTIVDSTAVKYRFSKANTELIVYDNGLPDICKAYLVSRSIEGLAPKTLKLYRTILSVFFSTIGRSLQGITTNDIRVWLYNREVDRKISKRTTELYREILNAFFTWATNEGWLTANPCAQIKPVKYQKKPRKAMNQMELEYIRDACKSEKETAIVEVLYSTGCRISELSNLKKSDINWERKEVTLLGKGSKYRTSYLNAKAVIALKKYLATRDDNNDAVIVTSHAPHKAIGKNGLETIIRDIAKRAGDKLSVPVTPHVFRHTTATVALQRGMPVQDVQLMLGHSNITTTMVYAEVNQGEVKAMHKKCVV